MRDSHMYRNASERGTKRSVAKTALIVIDMLNAYEHVDADDYKYLNRYIGQG